MEGLNKFKSLAMSPVTWVAVAAVMTVAVLSPWGIRNFVSPSGMAIAFICWAGLLFAGGVAQAFMPTPPTDDPRIYLEELLKDPSLAQRVWVVSYSSDTAQGELFARKLDGSRVRLAGPRDIFRTWPRLQRAGIEVHESAGEEA